jgi:small subunit ribosomal protein S21
MNGSNRGACAALGDSFLIGNPVQVLVRDNNVDQALRVLKKKMQREGVFREMKQRRAYEKPSERRTREKGEAIRRARKLARKQAQREGLAPMPKRKGPPAKPRHAERAIAVQAS